MQTIGIAGVSLYGGTKHNTAMGLRDVATFEEVRTMTWHSTSRAFKRYFRSEGDSLKSLYARRQSVVDNRVRTDTTEHEMNTEIINFKKPN